MAQTETRPSYRIVMDTNVLYAALRSRNGASHQILENIWARRVTLALSHSVLTEYEEILTREIGVLPIKVEEINPLLDDLCSISELYSISDYRPLSMQDEDDVSFVRLALAARTDYLVTHNVRHFHSANEKYGIKALAPRNFLAMIRL